MEGWLFCLHCSARKRESLPYKISYMDSRVDNMLSFPDVYSELGFGCSQEGLDEAVLTSTHMFSNQN